ncbi:CubicO group peptidase (beta-lactamase class C family) [Gillisia sp. Hel_I_86]|uniref:serine hydrolase domain-containing protein n=1 Tax=Gillisia sp. Hel_I_86 TaxID=1249981 RepID=UPI00119C44C3|nr:serine hydrolase domain-containing protein [Gillisia sp. Hel_I_86]TVZ27308.1 CubicO group peptidase (beta-lactamase class C family) [Gillisia sp. Hel_I_86]
MKNIIIAFLCVGILYSCKTTVNTNSKYSEKVKEVKVLLDSTELGKNFNGTILIADGKNILIQKAYGFNESNKETNALNTKYDLASMGKMFTAVSIMQLNEKDKITLDKTIGELLPDYPNDEAKSITIQQLLTHTSGLGDFFSPEFDENKDSIKNLADFLPFFINDPLEFKPGERMRYSNAGYIVLGLIIEKITGKNYSAYLTKNVFTPANMPSTGPLLSSAGGGNSTVEDLQKFALAFQNSELVNKESFSSMITNNFNNNYGYGMSLRDLNGTKIYGHNGGAPGISGELDMVVGEPLIIITMSNRSPNDGWAQVRTHIRKVFFGNTPEIEQFLNTEQVIKTYNEQGFEKASKKLTELGNNIIDRNTFEYAEKYATQGQTDKAIDLLKLMVQAYPDQWYPYSFLADFQVQAGQNEEAIKNYKKSLELNPENEQALEQLKKLE